MQNNVEWMFECYAYKEHIYDTVTYTLWTKEAIDFNHKRNNWWYGIHGTPVNGRLEVN
jgi:hypothetical protein